MHVPQRVETDFQEPTKDQLAHDFDLNRLQARALLGTNGTVSLLQRHWQYAGQLAPASELAAAGGGARKL